VLHQGNTWMVRDIINHQDRFRSLLGVNSTRRSNTLGSRMGVVGINRRFNFNSNEGAFYADETPWRCLELRLTN